MKTPRLIMRGDRTSPRHHIWPNNGTWFCHCSIAFPEAKTEKVERFRFSLQTADENEAGRRRDLAIPEVVQLLQFTPAPEPAEDAIKGFLDKVRMHVTDVLGGSRRKQRRQCNQGNPTTDSAEAASAADGRTIHCEPFETGPRNEIPIKKLGRRTARLHDDALQRAKRTDNGVNGKNFLAAFNVLLLAGVLCFTSGCGKKLALWTNVERNQDIAAGAPVLLADSPQPVGFVRSVREQDDGRILAELAITNRLDELRSGTVQVRERGRIALDTSRVALAA